MWLSFQVMNELLHDGLFFFSHSTPRFFDRPLAWADKSHCPETTEQSCMQMCMTSRRRKEDNTRYLCRCVWPETSKGSMESWPCSERCAELSAMGCFAVASSKSHRWIGLVWSTEYCTDSEACDMFHVSWSPKQSTSHYLYLLMVNSATVQEMK